MDTETDSQKLINASVTVDEACEMLGYKEITIRKWIEKGKINIVRVSGRWVRIPLSEIRRIRKEKASAVLEKKDPKSTNKSQEN